MPVLVGRAPGGAVGQCRMAQRPVIRSMQATLGAAGALRMRRAGGRRRAGRWRRLRALCHVHAKFYVCYDGPPAASFGAGEGTAGGFVGNTGSSGEILQC